MERDGLSLDLALLHINLVTTQHDRDVLADTDEVTWSTSVSKIWDDQLVIQASLLTVPVGDVLVGDAGSDIEHDDAALAVDVVAITETTELLLASSVPDVEGDVTEVLVMVRGCCAR